MLDDLFFFCVANVVKKSRFLSFPVWLKIVDDDRVSSKRDTCALCGGAHHTQKKNSPLIKQSVMRGEGARVHKKSLFFSSLSADIVIIIRARRVLFLVKLQKHTKTRVSLSLSLLAQNERYKWWREEEEEKEEEETQ